MSSTQPERPMILGNCISCNGLMRVPVTTDVSHVACCPHCDKRFPVQQLIAEAIPAAEIIEGEVAQDYTPAVDRVREPVDENVVKPRTRFEVPKQIYNGAKHRRRRRRRSRSSDERKEQAMKDNDRGRSTRPKINPSSVPLAATQAAPDQAVPTSEKSDTKAIDEVPVDSSGSRSSSSRSSSSSSPSSESRSSESRSSRNRSSSRRSSSRDQQEEEEPDSAVEWLKIGAGGFIAFPLAYLGLLWIAGLDPFGLAPTIHNVVPFVVPSSFVEDDTLPLGSEFDDLDSDFDEGLPMPSLDPDDVRY